MLLPFSRMPRTPSLLMPPLPLLLLLLSSFASVSCDTRSDAAEKLSVDAPLMYRRNRSAATAPRNIQNQKQSDRIVPSSRQSDIKRGVSALQENERSTGNPFIQQELPQVAVSQRANTTDAHRNSVVPTELNATTMEYASRKSRHPKNRSWRQQVQNKSLKLAPPARSTVPHEGFNRTRRQASRDCGSGWTMKGGSCYRVTRDALSWLEARAACNSYNGFLLEIYSRNQENDVYDFLNSNGIQRAWIALNDLRHERRWTWGDEKVARYTNWAPGEPNNVQHLFSNYHDEDCVEILATNRVGWNDNDCDAKFRGVCQKNDHDASCGGRIWGTGDIFSPAYPQQYPQGINCLWTVEATKVNTSISLTFGDFELLGDELVVSDGSEFQYTFTGRRAPYNLTLRPPIEIALASPKSPFIKDGNKFTITIKEVIGQAPRICRSGPWVMHGEMCLAALWYLPLSSRQEGSKECAMMGGYLAAIENYDQLQTVGEFLEYHAPSTDEVWIGLTYSSLQDYFFWDTGKAETYSSWDTGEPVYTPNATCVALTMQGVSGAWFSDYCDTPRVPLCFLLHRKSN